MHSIAPASWSAFYEAFDNNARLSRTPTGSWLPRNAQLLEVGALKVHSKADVPKVPPSHKHQWVRLADPSRQEIHLRKESEFVLQWLSLCFAHEQPRSLRCAPLMPCLSAADAFADKRRMGIGGWLSTARSFVWFSEIFSDEDIRQQWPQFSGSLQPYIGCFETLAQLALSSCPAPVTTPAQSRDSTNSSAQPSRSAPFCAWQRRGRTCTACSSRWSTWRVKKITGPMRCPADASPLYSTALKSGFA